MGKTMLTKGEFSFVILINSLEKEGAINFQMLGRVWAYFL